jgi:hypothetical protein
MLVHNVNKVVSDNVAYLEARGSTWFSKFVNT